VIRVTAPAYGGQPRDFSGGQDALPTITSDHLRTSPTFSPRKERQVATGTIKRLVSDRGFGFILQGDGTEIFFHRSAVTGTSFDQLREGQSVNYEKKMDPRRNKENAENVTPA
jgi:CspA family cold shock protein